MKNKNKNKNRDVFTKEMIQFLGIMVFCLTMAVLLIIVQRKIVENEIKNRCEPVIVTLPATEYDQDQNQDQDQDQNQDQESLEQTLEMGKIAVKKVIFNREGIHFPHSPSIEQIEEKSDTTVPLYNLSKDGWEIEAPAEWQHYIRRLCISHNIPERLVFGLIIAESCFESTCVGDGGASLGLGQINPLWLTSPSLTRISSEPEAEPIAEYRDLFNPYDNITTIVEILNWICSAYGLDIHSPEDQIKILYTYNTGQDPTGVTEWNYSFLVMQYAEEITPYLTE